MILDSLRFVCEQINISVPPGGPKVELGNISRYNNGESFTEGLVDKILLSVINVEEDTVVRQVEYTRRENNQILFANPPIYINLTLMFASTHTDYDSALISLEEVVLFFQKNRFFDAAVTPALEAYNAAHEVGIEKITFEMVNLSLEQVQQVWGGLGGHYMPSVIYKMRMLRLDAAVPQTGTPIKEIRIDTWHKNQTV